MGSEVSKPAEKASSNVAKANQFQIISPVSDISNPSEFRRRAPPLQRGNGAHDRRRASKVVATALSMPPRDVPAPQAFYFPTRESEKYSEKVSAGISPDGKGERRGKHGKKDQAGKSKWNRGKNRFRKKNRISSRMIGRENHGEAIGKDRKKPTVKPKSKKNEQYGDTEGKIILAKLDNKHTTIYESDGRDTKENTPGSDNHNDNQEKVKLRHKGGDEKAKIMRKEDAKKNSNRGNPPSLPTLRETQGLLLSDSLPEKKQTNSLDNHRTSESSQLPINNHEATPLQGPGALDGGAIGLHHEDEYFDRLALGDFSSNASPYVSNEAAASLALAPTLGVTSDSPESEASPVDQFIQLDKGLAIIPIQSLFRKSSVNEADGESKVGDVKTATNTNRSSLTNVIPIVDDTFNNSDSVDLFLDGEGEDSIRPDSASENISKRLSEDKIGSEERMEVNSIKNRRSSDAKPVADTSIGYGVQNKGSIMQILESPTSDDDDTYFKPDEKMNSESVFRLSTAASLPEEPIKQVASLGPSWNKNATEKRSKLESLFRPILPSLSDSDARCSMGSYDPFEIKVTESAPSVLQSSDYRAIALPSHFGSPGLVGQKGLGAQAAQSPSMMSVDSQVVGTPSSVRPMVSDQAVCNAQFLFTADYQKPKLLPRASNARRDSSMFSISTLGARSRLSQRSTRSQAVIIPVKVMKNENASFSSQDSKRVRFIDEKPNEKQETLAVEKSLSFEKAIVNDIVVPDIERKVSDLTDTLGDLDLRSSFESSKSCPKQDPIPEESSPECDSPAGKGSISCGDGPSMQPEDPLTTQSPEAGRVQWSYREEGNLSAVTPHLKGKKVTNATNSPFVRFKAAKTKFSITTDKIVPARKSLPATKVKTSSGGIVSARIKELNRRVSEARKTRKNRHSSGSGTSSNCEPNNMIRTAVILNYDPTAIGAGRFTLADAEGDESSVLSHDCDDQVSDLDPNQHPSTVVTVSSDDNCRESSLKMDSHSIEEWREDSDELRMSMESSSVATVRQDKEIMRPVGNFSLARPSIESVDTLSTASSGLSNIRKQVFRQQSAGSGKPRVSLSSSDGDSTTLSSIINKENSTYLPFRTGLNTVKPAEQRIHTAKQSLHLSPTQRTPAQARKWRSLAAAAQEKSSSRGQTGRGLGRQRKGLSARDANQMNVYGY